MTFRSILSTVALAGALAGTAYAHGTSPGATASDDALATPYGEALIQTETSPDDSSMSDGAFDWVASTAETTVRGVVEGQVDESD